MSLNLDNSITHSLGKYSEHQRQNWACSKRIIIYEDETQLRDFIKLARNDKTFDRKMYFGMIFGDIAQRIKDNTGIDVEGYNVTISASVIRKIFISHGDETTEALRGQRAIVEDDILRIPQIILYADKILLSPQPYGGNPVIRFVKTINERTTVVFYVSNKHKDVAAQTMYSRKKK
jgi:hypothetical protein